jgi:hypothetical protein
MWLVTDNLGAPRHCAWGTVKTPAEEPDPAKKSWAAALSDAEVTAGWDATTTAWNRAPQLSMPGVIDDAGAGSALVSRTLTIGGIDFDLDDAGRCNSKGACLAPDGVFTTIADAVALAESLSQDFTVVEKTTLKKVRVWSTQDPADPHPGDHDSGIYRQVSDSQVVRADA